MPSSHIWLFFLTPNLSALLSKYAYRLSYCSFQRILQVCVNICYVLLTGRERLSRNCIWGLEHDPRLSAEVRTDWRPRAQFFSYTERPWPVNNFFSFFFPEIPHFKLGKKTERLLTLTYTAPITWGYLKIFSQHFEFAVIVTLIKEKFGAVVLNAKSWTGCKRVISQSNSRIQDSSLLGCSKKKIFFRSRRAIVLSEF